MSNSKWNTLTKLMLGSMSLVGSIYVAHVTSGINYSDVGVAMYSNSGTALFSGLFLLVALLVLSNFVANRAFPSKENYLLVVFGGIFLILYLAVGSLML